MTRQFVLSLLALACCRADICNQEHRISSGTAGCAVWRLYASSPVTDTSNLEITVPLILYASSNDSRTDTVHFTVRYSWQGKDYVVSTLVRRHPTGFFATWFPVPADANGSTPQVLELRVVTLTTNAEDTVNERTQ